MAIQWSTTWGMKVVISWGPSEINHTCWTIKKLVTIHDCSCVKSFRKHQLQTFFRVTMPLSKEPMGGLKIEERKKINAMWAWTVSHRHWWYVKSRSLRVVVAHEWVWCARVSAPQTRREEIWTKDKMRRRTWLQIWIGAKFTVPINGFLIK